MQNELDLKSWKKESPTVSHPHRTRHLTQLVSYKYVCGNRRLLKLSSWRTYLEGMDEVPLIHGLRAALNEQID